MRKSSENRENYGKIIGAYGKSYINGDLWLGKSSTNGDFPASHVWSTEGINCSKLSKTETHNPSDIVHKVINPRNTWAWSIGWIESYPKWINCWSIHQPGPLILHSKSSKCPHRDRGPDPEDADVEIPSTWLDSDQLGDWHDVRSAWLSQARKLTKLAGHIEPGPAYRVSMAHLLNPDCEAQSLDSPSNMLEIGPWILGFGCQNWPQ